MVEGGAGTELTIDGSLFSPVADENEVRIGTALCNVTSANESQINCTMTSGSGSYTPLQLFISY